LSQKQEICVYIGSRRRAGSLVTVPKNYGHERKSTRTSSVAITYRDRIWQRSPQGVDATLSRWDPRNQLARAGASGTPSLSFHTDICGAKRPTPALHHRAGHGTAWSGPRFSWLRANVNSLKDMEREPAGNAPWPKVEAAARQLLCAAHVICAAALPNVCRRDNPL
jgi:hypothetical protein